MMPLPEVMVQYTVGEAIVLPLLVANAEQHPRLTLERKMLAQRETTKGITEALA